MGMRIWERVTKLCSVRHNYLCFNRSFEVTHYRRDYHSSCVVKLTVIYSATSHLSRVHKNCTLSPVQIHVTSETITGHALIVLGMYVYILFIWQYYMTHNFVIVGSVEQKNHGMCHILHAWSSCLFPKVALMSHVWCSLACIFVCLTKVYWKVTVLHGPQKGECSSAADSRVGWRLF